MSNKQKIQLVLASLLIGLLITVGASLVNYELYVMSSNTVDGKYTLDEFINFSQYVDISFYSLAEFISFKLMFITSIVTFVFLSAYMKFLGIRMNKDETIK